MLMTWNTFLFQSSNIWKHPLLVFICCCHSPGCWWQFESQLCVTRGVTLPQFPLAGPVEQRAEHARAELWNLRLGVKFMFGVPLVHSAAVRLSFFLLYCGVNIKELLNKYLMQLLKMSETLSCLMGINHQGSHSCSSVMFVCLYRAFNLESSGYVGQISEWSLISYKKISQQLVWWTGFVILKTNVCFKCYHYFSLGEFADQCYFKFCV